MPVEAPLLRAFHDRMGNANRSLPVSGQLITCRVWQYPIAPTVNRCRQSPARLRPPLFGGGKRIPKVTSKLVLRLGMCNEGEPDRRPFRIPLTTEPRPL